jgi:hypothetical protein
LKVSVANAELQLLQELLIVHQVKSVENVHIKLNKSQNFLASRLL